MLSSSAVRVRLLPVLFSAARMARFSSSFNGMTSGISDCGEVGVGLGSGAISSCGVTSAKSPETVDDAAVIAAAGGETGVQVPVTGDEAGAVMTEDGKDAGA